MSQQPLPNHYDDEIDLVHYFKLLKQHFWPLSFFVAICTGISIAVALMLTPIYQTSTSLLINTDKINTVAIKELVEQGNENIATHLDTQLQIINSNNVMLAVIDELGLSQNPDFIAFEETTPQHIIEAKTLEQLRSSTTINLVKGTKVIKVTATSQNPELAKAIADAIANVYIKQSGTNTATLANETFSWLQNRASDLKAALKEAELATLQYKETHKLFDVASEKQTVANEINFHSDSLKQLKTAENGIQQDLAILTQASKLPLKQMLTKLSNRGNFAKLQSKIAGLELKIEHKSKRYGPKHSEMITLNEQLEEAQEQALKGLKTAIENTKNKLALNHKLAGMHQQDLQESRKAYQNLQLKTFELKDLVRAEKSHREMYNIFSKRARETMEASSFATPEAKIIDQAIVPIQPVKPKKKLIVILAFLLSGMVGLGFIIVLDSFRQQISNKQ